MLRPFWGKLVRWNSFFGVVLIFLFGIPRFIIVLKANQTGDYRFVSTVFLFMWLAPYLLLTSQGRSSIGMKKPIRYRWLFYSFFTGIALCIVMFGVAEVCFGNTISNWFVYISRSYSVSEVVRAATGPERMFYFLLYGLVGMTFSPIGEELLYRGMIHGSFATQWGEHKASLTDSLAFSMTHLAHFGIVYISFTWTFLALPGLLWIFFMFGASRLFFVCKEKTGSILGAILCHAGFNLAMTYVIFYYILSR